MTPKPYYQDSAVTIYHGDCREILPGLGKFDLLLTDPPYAISLAGVSHDKGGGHGVRRLDFFEGDDDWAGMTDLWIDALRLSIDALRDEGSAYAWVGHRQFGRTVSTMEALGFSTRFLTWIKKCPPPAPPGSGWPSAAELCVYGYRKGRTWNHSGSNPPPSNVIHADSFRHGQPGKVAHPTQKPISVISPIILASSSPQDMILDPFAGSGTTGRAAKDLGRKAVLIEREERYCEIAARRMAQEVLAL